MAPLVLGGIARFTLHGTIHGRQWANVYHVHVISDSGTNRDDHVVDQAVVFLNEWIDHIAIMVASVCILQGCRYLDLDSLSGVAGDAVTPTSPRTIPKAGAASGNPLAGNSAVLVRKTATGGRSARGGRAYLPGFDESDFTGNTLIGSMASSINTNMGNFLSGINQSGRTPGIGSGTYDSEMVVVHTPKDAAASYSKVTALTADGTMATQRRRLRS